MFVDFDGTVTDRDTFDVLVPLFATKAVWDATERALDQGRATIREVLASQAALVRGERSEVNAILRREVNVDPSFAAFARACAAAAVPLTIVSSGIESIIRDRLGDFGLDALPVVANDVEVRPEGWSMRFRDAAGNGTDKAALVDDAIAHGLRTIFVGDGRSDFDASLRADVRFAKRGLPLERYLARHEATFERFDSFEDVERRCAALGVFGT